MKNKNVLQYFKDYIADYQDYQTYWNYEDGCVLIGCQYLYEATGDVAFKDFVLNYLERFIKEDGTISNYNSDAYNIDSINCGKVLFFAYDQTKNEKYRKAIEFLMDRLRTHPRTKSNNFWHKDNYPNQVWLDGIYMAQPFYAAYETRFDNFEHYQDIIGQLKLVRDKMYDPYKQLYYHGWDEAGIQPWANKDTHLSANFWLRSIGWLEMALVDIISLLDPRIYEDYRYVQDMFRESIKGVLRWQDPQSALFYQVVDRSDVDGNYLETSGSSMIAYAVLKGCRIGTLLSEKYQTKGLRIVESLVENKLLDKDGKLQLTDICKVGGLGPGAQRDGSVAYYLSEPIVTDDAKGVGPFMMAYAEYLKSEK